MVVFAPADLLKIARQPTDTIGKRERTCSMKKRSPHGYGMSFAGFELPSFATSFRTQKGYAVLLGTSLPSSHRSRRAEESQARELRRQQAWRHYRKSLDRCQTHRDLPQRRAQRVGWGRR